MYLRSSPDLNEIVRAVHIRRFAHTRILRKPSGLLAQYTRPFFRLISPSLH